jgi:Domain of unknown function (DUF4412)
MHSQKSPLVTGSLLLILLTSLFASSCSKNTTAVNNNSPAPGATSSSSNFEGTVAMKIEGDNERTMQMTYFLKGNRTRIETNLPDSPEGSAVMLWDTEGGKITTLMPSRKMYVTMDLKQAAEDFKGTKKSRGEDDTEFPKLTSTGKQETIAGHVCEHWLMGENQEVDICVAKGLGYFGMGGQSAGGLGSWKNFVFSPKMLAQAAAHPEWVKFLEGGAFPLKLSAKSDGRVMMTMEATKIEKKALDDSIFSVPPDYKEMSVPGIPAGKR